MADLVEKHRSGTNEIDHPDRAPTGHPYQEVRRQQAAAQARQRQQKLATAEEELVKNQKVDSHRRQGAEQLDLSDDSDYDDLLEDDDDPVLGAIREKRMAELRKQQVEHAENISKGHGQFRTISQDQFLPECTGSSEFVVVHFFHNEWERCKVMDHHLKVVAMQHTESKFLRIDAEKAPFFVSKLQIQTLPTVVVFRDGKSISRLTGFEGLCNDPKEPDKWETRALKQYLASTGAIKYTPSADELREDLELLEVNSRRSGVYRGGVSEFHEE